MDLDTVAIVCDWFYGGHWNRLIYRVALPFELGGPESGNTSQQVAAHASELAKMCGNASQAYAEECGDTHTALCRTLDPGAFSRLQAQRHLGTALSLYRSIRFVDEFRACLSCSFFLNMSH